MAQIEQVGASTSYTSDGKKLVKRVYLLTDGTTSVTVPSGLGAVVGADFTSQEAGTTRVELTFQQGASSSAGTAAVASSGATEELIGGSREVPVKTHEYFSELSRAELAEVDRAFNEQDPAQQYLRGSAFSSTEHFNRGSVLLGLLQKGVESYLVPALVFRETVVQSSKPTLQRMTTIHSPVNGPAINSGWNWLLTALNYTTVQSPTTGSLSYVTTREWTLSGRGGWQAHNTGDFKLYRYG